MSDNVVKADNARIANQVDNFDELMHDAAKGGRAELEMSVTQAFRVYKKAVFWSMALSAALIMEGYDVVIIGSYYGHPSFLNRFGVMGPEGKKIIPADWQSGLSNGSSAGGILGLIVNSYASEYFGPRKTYLAGMVLMIVFIFIPFFATNLATLVAGEVLCGIPWGIFQTLTTAYAAEVCPIQLRGYLTAYVNCCWGLGILLSSGVVRATVGDLSDLGWKLPFAIQWVWPVPLFIMAWFVPESPYWLVRRGRHEDAENAMRRLRTAEYTTEQNIKDTVANIIYTNEMEKEITKNSTIIDCFKGLDRRRTEIAMMTFAGQLLSGQNLIGQGVQFLQRAGMGDVASFNMNMVLNSMFCLGTFFSWFLMYLGLGRRTLYLAGFVMMDVVLWIIGGLAFTDSKGASLGSGVLLVILNFAYNSTLGPMCYTIISEVGSTRLRQQTVVLARIAYQIMNIICGIIVPRMLSPAAWNWGSKSGLFWGGVCFLTLIYMYLRLPETRGRSYAELDVLFERRIPAWRFASTKVDLYHDAPIESAVPAEKEELAHEEVMHSGHKA